jgi:hypothetical protein
MAAGMPMIKAKINGGNGENAKMLNNEDIRAIFDDPKFIF